VKDCRELEEGCDRAGSVADKGNCTGRDAVVGDRIVCEYITGCGVAGYTLSEP